MSNKSVDCFFENLQASKELSLIDVASYNGKTDEGQAIYIKSLDKTFIAINSNNSYWSLLSLVHEVGHAYYNFLHKQYVLTVSSRIDSEIEAYIAELDFILHQKDNVIKSMYLFFYLSQTILYGYSLLITKSKLYSNNFSSNLIAQYTFEYMPWEYGHINELWVDDQVDKDSLYYFLARIIALYLHNADIPKSVMQVTGWSSIDNCLKNYKYQRR